MSAVGLPTITDEADEQLDDNKYLMVLAGFEEPNELSIAKQMNLDQWPTDDNDGESETDETNNWSDRRLIESCPTSSASESELAPSMMPT